MGAGQSTTQFATPPSRALHVLRVTPDSPASKTTIEPLFDFVVGFEGDSLASQNNIDAVALEKIVEGHEGRNLNLLVWNTKSQETRVVPIVPSRAWSQPSNGSAQEDAAAQPSLLGLSMRMCEPELAMDNVWHVLDVLEGSPAESAGLVPYGDYITGWSGGVLSAENDFYELVEAHVDKPLRVYVYSHVRNALREVVLVPNRHWGGEGLLGCVFGYGLLHRIPPQPAERSGTPPELHDMTDEYEEQELFVPADIPTPQNVPSQLADWRRQQEYEHVYRPTPVAPILEEELNGDDGHAHDGHHGYGHGLDHHDHDHEHDHHGHVHHAHDEHGGHGYAHREHHTSPPRRTSSLTANSSLRSSRVPTPVFSAPGRVPSISLNNRPNAVSNGGKGSDEEASTADDDADHESLTSVEYK
ncbi:Golgi reassembly stacking protein 2 [Mycena sanguinolenta]|uniref:Golgi reassembly stacking protein 2 n=1 Tax=Mycena sanguinolenta TaxID=230812 RepID=A0A8H6XTJ6_9AGAR|nr:Golgi reassembly stacking protein 2 [Mycena sanguinolenta]